MKENYQPVMIKTLLKNYPKPISKYEMTGVFKRYNKEKSADFERVVWDVYHEVLGPNNHNIVNYNIDTHELSLNLKSKLSKTETSNLISICDKKIKDFEEMVFSTSFFIAVGPWSNWNFSLSHSPLKWGVRDDKKILI